MIGKTISHYRILKKLGEGGMGIVYKAEDTKLKRIVALKFLPSSFIASEAEKTRFIHEAQAAAALNHPTDAVPTSARSMKLMRLKVMELSLGLENHPRLECSGLENFSSVCHW
jgi:serine/threonine protein kinase